MRLCDITTPKYRRHQDCEDGIGAGRKFDTTGLPVVVEALGFSRRMPPERTQRARSERTALELVTAGRAIYIQNRQTYYVGPGELFILRDGASHDYSAAPGNSLHKRYMTIGGPLLNEILQSTGLDQIDHVRPERPLRVERYFREAHRVAKEDAHNCAAALSGLLYRILIEGGRSMTSTHPRQVSDAIAFLKERIDKPTTLEDLTAVTGVSRSQIESLFHRHLGLSPLHYLNKLRMRKAEFLLGTTQLTISHIAAAIGMTDTSHANSNATSAHHPPHSGHHTAAPSRALWPASITHEPFRSPTWTSVRAQYLFRSHVLHGSMS